jgi:hypothetical protein
LSRLEQQAERESDTPAPGVTLEEFQRIQQDAEAGITRAESEARVQRYLLECCAAGKRVYAAPEQQAPLISEWQAGRLTDDQAIALLEALEQNEHL